MRESQQTDVEKVPYVHFLNFFRLAPRWSGVIKDPESAFMRLLQIDGLFMRKSLLKINGEQAHVVKARE